MVVIVSIVARRYEKCQQPFQAKSSLQFFYKYWGMPMQMYMLHQVSAKDLRTGDQITLKLKTDKPTDYFIVQYPAMGDRYALHIVYRG